MEGEEQQAPAEEPERNYGYHAGMEDAITEDVIETEETPAAEEEKANAPEEKPEAPKPEPEPQPAPQPAPVVSDWRDELKKQDKYAVLKELGYDDFTLEMLKYKEAKGDLTPYLEAKSVDYTKMTADQLFLRKIKRDNPELSDRALAFKMKKELNEKYYLDRDVWDEDSDEAKVGQELMAADAEKLRKSFTDEQAKFIAPEPEVQPQTNPAEIVNKIEGSDASQRLMKAGQLTFGGEDKHAFHFPVDAKAIISQAAKTISSMGVEDISKINLDDFYRNLAIGSNWKEFEKAFADHYKNVGKLMVQEELQNITPPDGSVPTPGKELTPAQKLAREGRIV